MTAVRELAPADCSKETQPPMRRNHRQLEHGRDECCRTVRRTRRSQLLTTGRASRSETRCSSVVRCRVVEAAITRATPSNYSTFLTLVTVCIVRVEELQSTSKTYGVLSDVFEVIFKALWTRSSDLRPHRQISININTQIVHAAERRQ